MPKDETGLTDKQELFCQKYVFECYRNATHAAIAAGYSEKTADVQGSRLLRNVKVASRVRALREEMQEKSGVDALFILEGAKQVFDRCTQAVPVTQWCHREKAYVDTGEWEQDSKGAIAALRVMGDHVDLGAFNNKIQVDGLDSLATLIVSARKRASGGTDDE